VANVPRAPIFNRWWRRDDPYSAIRAAEVGHENRPHLPPPQFPTTPPTYASPNPRAPVGSIALRTFVYTNTLALTLNPMPLGLDDWPVPRAAAQPSFLRTFTDSFKPELLGQDQFFTSPGDGPAYDFPNPRGTEVGYNTRRTVCWRVL